MSTTRSSNRYENIVSSCANSETRKKQENFDDDSRHPERFGRNTGYRKESDSIKDPDCLCCNIEIRKNDGNFEDPIRCPACFGRGNINARFGSEEEDERVVFPDDPVFPTMEKKESVEEAKIEDVVVFPNSKSKVEVSVTDGLESGEGLINLR